MDKCKVFEILNIMLYGVNVICSVGFWMAIKWLDLMDNLENR